MPEPLLRLEGVSKSYGELIVTRVLHDVDLSLQGGELTALMGPSGSGKSTLLNLIGLLDTPTTGSIHVAGENTTGLAAERLTELRATSIGFVFQFHHLLGALTAAENLMVPLAIRDGGMTRAARERALVALEAVGLGDRADALPRQLSGGQQQRVAIARALVHEPALVLADEPTGNLDTSTADEIFALLRRVNRERSMSFLIVTHDPRLAARCDRVVSLVDGRIASDVRGGGQAPR